jgi:probable F420-dependent oxidoreductase
MTGVAVVHFATEDTMPVAELAVEIEARGLYGLFLPEHTHIPISQKSEYIGVGGILPDWYKRFLDPFVSLAVAAASTRTIRLGTSISLAHQHDPIALAKTVATLDVISGGRFVFGVGWGWNAEEMQDHGVPYAQRRAILREKVLTMRALWQDDVASFAGEHVHLSSSWAWPKPRNVRVMLGAQRSPANLRHLFEWADGWMPIIKDDGFVDEVRAFRVAAEEAGRDPSTLPIIASRGRPDAKLIAELTEINVECMIAPLPAAGRDELLPVLDALASAQAVAQGRSN